MKKDLLLFFVILSAIFFIISCGSSGSEVAGGGTGGTGIVSSGQITAKGSITVNGVKFETQAAQIFQDGALVSDDSQLKVGMIVEIEGTVNSNTGTASIVRFDDSVEGPITMIDALARTLEVLGQPVLVDDLTVFDNSTIIPPDITGLNLNDIVEVSGQLDDLGNIRATHIEKKPASTEVEVTGFVTGKIGNTFLINNLTIDFSAATLENFGGGQPADGDFVEVKGLFADFDPALNTLDAASVENKAKDIDDGLEAEVEGFVETLTAGGFTVVATSGRVDVQVDGATVFSGGLAADLQVGVKIEAEGQILGGVLLADKVSFKDNIRIEVAAAVQADGDPLTVELLLLPAVVVRVDDRTRLDDKRSGAPVPTDPAALLASINANDALKIRGRVAGGEVLATELEVDDSSGNLDRVDLRGPVDADPIDTRFFEVLGILIDTDIVPGTTFEDINGNPIVRSTFFGFLQAGTPVDVRGDLNPSGDRIDASELGLED